jgi:hypothetical protein
VRNGNFTCVGLILWNLLRGFVHKITALTTISVMSLSKMSSKTAPRAIDPMNPDATTNDVLLNEGR